MTADKPLNTISIAFEDVFQFESLALYSEHEGMKLVEDAQRFVSELSSEDKTIYSERAILFFWTWYSMRKDKLDLALDGFSIEQDGISGNNQGNGHYVISLLTGEVVKHLE